MKKTRPVLSVCLALIGMIAVLFGYLPNNTAYAADAVQGEVQTLEIVSGGKSSYVIITPKGASADADTASRELRDAIRKKTGASLTRKNDGTALTSKPSETEILLGNTNRAESASVLKDVPYGEYAVRVVNRKIVIAAWDDEALVKGCQAFADYITETGKSGKLSVNSDYESSGVAWNGIGVIPHYKGKAITFQYVDLADKSYMLYVAKTTHEEFDSYVETVKGDGFEEISRRQAGKMLYAICSNGETILHMSFNSVTKEARIAADKAYDMTLFTETEYKKVCEPSVTMVGQEFTTTDPTAVPVQNALCLVFQLEDGRFIIVDGGYSTASINMLYKTLRKLHVGKGKITIAAWIFTHAHADHVRAFVELSNTTLKKRLVVENFVHHFSTDTQYGRINDYAQSGNARSAMRGYKDANIIKAHSGQVIKAGGVEIEMLFTYGDMEPSPLEQHNTTSLVFRVTAQDNSVMVLGDASNQSLQYMYRVYGDYLKSDMVQIAHHGYNGIAEIYRKIDADVVLWPGGVSQFYGRDDLIPMKDKDYNKAALNSAEECYVAGDSVFTLILPYTPKDNKTVKIYDGE